MPFTIDATTHRSPNQGARPIGASPLCVVVHSCEGRPSGNEETTSIPWLCNPSSKVSCHYYVTRAGTIYCLVPVDREAWHAGRSVCPGVPQVDGSINAHSIGIELEHAVGAPPYPQIQLDALAWLLQKTIVQYPAITPETVVSHRAVALPKGRKSDPTDWNEASFRAWVTTTLRPREMRHGFILTNADLPRARASVTAGRYSALKLVTAWGPGHAWTEAERQEAVALAPFVLVRTHAGDPSSGKPYPHREEVIQELAPWIGAGVETVEIGNEPNAPYRGELLSPAGYAWHLEGARMAVKSRWPHVKVVAPALLPEPSAASWIRDPFFEAALRACDYIGVHIYEHTTFVGPGHTNAYEDAEKLYARFTGPRFLTEYGINHYPDGGKYARFVRSLPPIYRAAFSYHLDVSPGAAYQLGLAGDKAYGEAW